MPTGMTPDSEDLFERRTEVTLDGTRAAPGRRIVGVARGVGQAAIGLAGRGASVVGAEPSGRMIGMARVFAADKPGPMPHWVRGWSDRLPFADESFDACICKGALYHFDSPERAIGEMTRVTRSAGRVVLAIANFESLACRVGRAQDDLRDAPRCWPPRRPTKASACPYSKRWPAARLWWRATPPRPRRSPATRRCSSIRSMWTVWRRRCDGYSPIKRCAPASEREGWNTRRVSHGRERHARRLLCTNR